MVTGFVELQSTNGLLPETISLARFPATVTRVYLLSTLLNKTANGGLFIVFSSFHYLPLLTVSPPTLLLILYVNLILAYHIFSSTACFIAPEERQKNKHCNHTLKWSVPLGSWSNADNLIIALEAACIEGYCSARS